MEKICANCVYHSNIKCQNQPRYYWCMKLSQDGFSTYTMDDSDCEEWYNPKEKEDEKGL